MSESYKALYRKWRPLAFSEIRGQEHITRTLQNQVVTGKVGHAYLFCGTRGTGKTTAAKILARAVNCEHPREDGSPCNECAVCKAILNGSSMNVTEFDAASNNGVEDIRNIREEIQYTPSEGKYRVYIIDEVHMLSKAAFNAFLKTLEEPPEYVIFILATTEPQAIPITILSRCQRYDFRRIGNQTIREQLKMLTDAEGIKAEEKALAYIAKVADGSMRDALSLLEQCMTFYFDEQLTYDNVLDVLGAVDREVFSKMLTCLLEKDVSGCVHLTESILEQGRDLNQFVIDFTLYLRNLLLLQTAADAEELIDMSGDNMKLLREEAMKMDPEMLIRYIRHLSDLSNQLRYAVSKRVIMEIALIRMMMPVMEENLDALQARVTDLESQMADICKNGVALKGNASASGAGTGAEASAGGSAGNAGVGGQSDAGSGTFSGNVRVVEVPKAVYEDYQVISGQWLNILRSLPHYHGAVLNGKKLSYNNEKGYVVEVDPWSYSLITPHIDTFTELISEACAELCQKELHVTFVKVAEQEQTPETRLVVGERIKGINMEITQEEE